MIPQSDYKCKKCGKIVIKGMYHGRVFDKEKFPFKPVEIDETIFDDGKIRELPIMPSMAGKPNVSMIKEYKCKGCKTVYCLDESWVA